jgi:hypothetical protein
VKRFAAAGLTAAAFLFAGHTEGLALEKLTLQVSPTVSMAPASVVVRAIITPDAENRQLEIVADSESFYRRSVVDLEGEAAPKVNELRLLDIPGGEYEVTATLYDSRGARTTAHRTLMVQGLGGR